jgi:hypothetical protein
LPPDMDAADVQQPGEEGEHKFSAWRNVWETGLPARKQVRHCAHQRLAGCHPSHPVATRAGLATTA